VVQRKATNSMNRYLIIAFVIVLPKLVTAKITILKE